MTDDPYVYPDTDVLINKENIRDADELEQFERLMTVQRISEGFPKVPLTADGYRQLHEHIFQDVYEWAGENRTVNIAKNGNMFCVVDFIEPQLNQRFDLIAVEHGLKNLTADQFAERAGEHLSELNAIHPFREGNGRTMRAFLVVLGEQAGHQIDLNRIDPEAWNEASRHSFSTAETAPMREVIAKTMIPVREEERGDNHAPVVDNEIQARSHATAARLNSAAQPIPPTPAPVPSNQPMSAEQTLARHGNPALQAHFEQQQTQKRAQTPSTGTPDSATPETARAAKPGGVSVDSREQSKDKTKQDKAAQDKKLLIALQRFTREGDERGKDRENDGGHGRGGRGGKPR